MKSLSADILQEMRTIGLKVREELNAGHPEKANAELMRGWSLIPEPKSEYENSISFARSALRLLALSGKPSLAVEWADKLKQLPLSDIDAEPDFLMGVMLYELKDEASAFTHFDRANKMSKGRCFQGEDKKYQAFYKTQSAAKK